MSKYTANIVVYELHTHFNIDPTFGSDSQNPGANVPLK